MGRSEDPSSTGTCRTTPVLEISFEEAGAVPGAAPDCVRHAPDERRSAGRVPERRPGFERGGRVHGQRLTESRSRLLRRLRRRSGVERAVIRPHGGRPLQDRPPSSSSCSARRFLRVGSTSLIEAHRGAPCRKRGGRALPAVKLAREHVTVILSARAATRYWPGYPLYQIMPKVDRRTLARPRAGARCCTCCRKASRARRPEVPPTG